MPGTALLSLRAGGPAPGAAAAASRMTGRAYALGVRRAGRRCVQHCSVTLTRTPLRAAGFPDRGYRRAGGRKGTPATALLARQKVEHRLHSYAHGAGQAYGPEAAEPLGLDPARVFKTLVAEVDGALTVGVVPVSATLDLKALAAAVGGKRARMADVAAAERATGYVAGGISPLGGASGCRPCWTPRPRSCRRCSAAPGGAGWRWSWPRPTSRGWPARGSPRSPPEPLPVRTAGRWAARP